MSDKEQPEEKSCLVKTATAIWQLPVFSVMFLVMVYVSCIGMYDRRGTIEDKMQSTFPDLDDTKWLLWSLIGVFVIDSCITFISFLTSEWVYDACCNDLMKNCACCTSFMCYGFNWFFFVVSYILGIGFILLTVSCTVIIVVAAMGKGACDEFLASDPDGLVDLMNKMIKALHDFICDNTDDVKCGSGFPASLPNDFEVTEFCSDVNDVIGNGAAIFAYMGVVAVAQWSFVIIQRANLVEGAARRGFARVTAQKEAAASPEAEMGDHGPNV